MIATAAMVVLAILLAASIAIHTLRKRRGLSACPLTARSGGGRGSKTGCGCGL